MVSKQCVPSYNIWRNDVVRSTVIRIRRLSPSYRLILITILDVPIRGLLDHVLLGTIILFTLLCGRRYSDVIFRTIWTKIMPIAFWGSVASSGQRLHWNVVGQVVGTCHLGERDAPETQESATARHDSRGDG